MRVRILCHHSGGKRSTCHNPLRLASLCPVITCDDQHSAVLRQGSSPIPVTCVSIALKLCNTSCLTCDGKRSALPRRRRGSGERRARPCPGDQVQQEQVIAAPRARAPEEQQVARVFARHHQRRRRRVPRQGRCVHVVALGGTCHGWFLYTQACACQKIEIIRQSFCACMMATGDRSTVPVTPWKGPRSGKHKLRFAVISLPEREPPIFHFQGSMPVPSVMTRFQIQVERSKWCTSFRRRRSAPRPPNTTSRCAAAS